ncbi:Non-specific serine/threonine protein kinase [Rhodotorula toruloides]|nr:Non-specific serine/threonine protein kinase [Rhodotorula toruloides]
MLCAGTGPSILIALVGSLDSSLNHRSSLRSAMPHVHFTGSTVPPMITAAQNTATSSSSGAQPSEDAPAEPLSFPELVTHCPDLLSIRKEAFLAFILEVFDITLYETPFIDLPPTIWKVIEKFLQLLMPEPQADRIPREQNEEIAGWHLSRVRAVFAAFVDVYNVMLHKRLPNERLAFGADTTRIGGAHPVSNFYIQQQPDGDIVNVMQAVHACTRSDQKAQETMQPYPVPSTSLDFDFASGTPPVPRGLCSQICKTMLASPPALRTALSFDSEASSLIFSFHLYRQSSKRKFDDLDDDLRQQLHYKNTGAVAYGLAVSPLVPNTDRDLLLAILASIAPHDILQRAFAPSIDKKAPDPLGAHLSRSGYTLNPPSGPLDAPKPTKSGADSSSGDHDSCTGDDDAGGGQRDRRDAARGTMPSPPHPAHPSMPDSANSLNRLRRITFGGNTYDRVRLSADPPREPDVLPPRNVEFVMSKPFLSSIDFAVSAAQDVSSAASVVIKEARTSMGYGALRKEANILTSLAAAGLAHVAPPFVGLFEGSCEPYRLALVTQRCGQSLDDGFGSLTVEQRVDIYNLLADLHEHGYEHADFAARNVVFDGSTFRLIDYECAWTDHICPGDERCDELTDAQRQLGLRLLGDDEP